jgi:hypothetical protein
VTIALNEGEMVSRGNGVRRGNGVKGEMVSGTILKGKWCQEGEMVSGTILGEMVSGKWCQKWCQEPFYSGTILFLRNKR